MHTHYMSINTNRTVFLNIVPQILAFGFMLTIDLKTTQGL